MIQRVSWQHEDRFLCQVKIENAMRALFTQPQAGIGLLVYKANVSAIDVYYLKEVVTRYTLSKYTYQVFFLYFFSIFTGRG